MQNLILLHGALGSQDQFEKMKGLLSGTFDVHTLNFEGHGGRPSHREFSISFFSENVLDYLAANNLHSAHLFGYSMGGFVALHFARKHPEKVSSIITLATKFDWNTESAAREAKMLNPAIIELKVPKFAGLLQARHGEQNWKTVLQKTADMMTGLGNGQAFTQTDLSQIKNDCSIGIGDADNMVSIAESRWAAESLPNGKLEVLEGVQHPIEKVEDTFLAELISKHLID